MTRTFVVGLDGASWRLVDPWLEDGTLPNLAELRDGGTWATSESCLPPVTFPNWKCYSSGKNPGGFGVYWFERVDLENGRIDVTGGGDFRTAELWDYLNAAGFSTGIVNMPTMYPPRELDGLVVAGGPDATEGEYRTIGSGYTYPAELERRLVEDYGYRVHPDPLLSSSDERGEEVEAILDLIDLRFEVALDLFVDEEMDFLHVTAFYLNVLQHFFWNDEPTRRAWESIDDWLGRLAALEDTNLVVMSDHGCAPTTTEFYVNEWLAREGYLVKRRTAEDYLTAVGVNRENALRVAKRLRAVGLLERLVPEWLQRRVPLAAGAKRQRKLEKVVLAETKALASGQGPVYLNPAFEREALLAELIGELRAVADEDGPLFSDVHRGSELYSGPFVDDAPEVVVEQRPGVHVNDGIGPGTVFAEPVRWAAENTSEGVFLAAGPDFAPRGDLGTVHIVDIAPTILAGYGVDVPSDMDGEVLPVFRSEPDIGTREPLERVLAKRFDETDEVGERLRELGYLE